MHTSPTKLWKKVATSASVLALLVTFAVPQRAHALFGVGDIVIDPTNLIQNTTTALNSAAQYTLEYALDGLAWEVANLAIQSMSKSIVNWINSGFEGSPAFVTDLRYNLRGVGDAVAARFFEELANQEIATTPFQDKVLDAVRLGYYLRTSPESFYTRHPYTLNQVSPDPDSFLAGNFDQGGWDAWFETIMNPQNNPFGAQELANRTLEDAVAAATGDRLEELSWNRGFLSWRGKCIDGGQQQPPGIDSSLDGAPVDLSNEEECYDYEIRTPGSVIMESLNKVEGVPFDRLVSADEFNEIIGALLNQLALEILGGGEDGGGVRGLSQPSNSGGGSFFDRTEGTSGNATNIANTFSSSVARQIEQLETFQANWERIRDVAETAEARCGAGGDPDPAEVLSYAQTMLVKAANGLAALRAIKADIDEVRTAGGNQSGALIGITQAYNELTTSGTLPTPEEISEAQIESQDTGDADPGSLYSEMARLSASLSCRAND